MFNADAIAAFAVRLDDRLSSSPDQLPLDLLPEASQPVARSQIAALMLEIAMAYRGFDREWLRQQFSDARIGVMREHSIELLRSIFRQRIEMRQRVAFEDFDAFGFTSDELKLAGEDECVFLGQVLADDFLLVERIAAGGVAVVYRAINVKDGLQVAAKCPIGRRGTPEIHERAMRLRLEGNILGLLQVNGVPRRVALSELDFGPVLLTEWIESPYGTGIPPHFPLAERLRIVGSLARTLDEIHQRDLIHGDVKSDNVLVDHEGTPWLLDFNVAQSIGSGRSIAKRSGGTRSMMNELTRRGVGLDAGISRDIYSLGLMLGEMLCGSAFTSQVQSDFRTSIRMTNNDATRIAFPTSIPDSLRRICEGAVAPMVQLRFDSAADLADAIERFIEHGEDIPDVVPVRRSIYAWLGGNRLGRCRFHLAEITTAIEKLERTRRLPSLQEIGREASPFRQAAWPGGLAPIKESIERAVQEGMEFYRVCLRFGIRRANMDWLLEFRRCLDTFVERRDVDGLRALEDGVTAFRESVTSLEQEMILAIGPETRSSHLFQTAYAMQCGVNENDGTRDIFGRHRKFRGRNVSPEEYVRYPAMKSRLPPALVERLVESARHHPHLWARPADFDWSAAVRSIEYGVTKWLRWKLMPVAAESFVELGDSLDAQDH